MKKLILVVLSAYFLAHVWSWSMGVISQTDIMGPLGVFFVFSFILLLALVWIIGRSFASSLKYVLFGSIAVFVLGNIWFMNKITSPDTGEPDTFFLPSVSEFVGNIFPVVPRFWF